MKLLYKGSTILYAIIIFLNKNFSWNGNFYFETIFGCRFFVERMSNNDQDFAVNM